MRGAQPPRHRAVRLKETPKLRPCLAPEHDHLIWCTKGNRLCEAGRDALRRLDPLYGAPGANPRSRELYQPWQGIAVSA